MADEEKKEMRIINPKPDETYRVMEDDSCLVVSSGKEEDSPKVWISKSMANWIRDNFADKPENELEHISLMKFSDEDQKEIMLQILDHGSAMSQPIEIIKDFPCVFQTIKIKDIQDIQEYISKEISKGRNYEFITNLSSLLNIVCGIYSIKGKKLEGTLEQKKSVLESYSDIVLNILRKKFLSFVRSVELLVQGSDQNFSTPS